MTKEEYIKKVAVILSRIEIKKGVHFLNDAPEALYHLHLEGVREERNSLLELIDKLNPKKYCDDYCGGAEAMRSDIEWELDKFTRTEGKA